MWTILYSQQVSAKMMILSEVRCAAILVIWGITFDEEKNKGLRGKEEVLSTPDSKVKVFVIPTNEELAIARETMALVK